MRWQNRKEMSDYMAGCSGGKGSGGGKGGGTKDTSRGNDKKKKK